MNSKKRESPRDDTVILDVGEVQVSHARLQEEICRIFTIADLLDMKNADPDDVVGEYPADQILKEINDDDIFKYMREFHPSEMNEPNSISTHEHPDNVCDNMTKWLMVDEARVECLFHHISEYHAKQKLNELRGKLGTAENADPDDCCPPTAEPSDE